MQALMQTYQKHLADVAEFAPETVENYISCLIRKNKSDFN